MTRKRKNKNIIIERDAYDFYKRTVLPQHHIKIEDNLTIVDKKVFVTTIEEEEDESKREEI